MDKDVKRMIGHLNTADTVLYDITPEMAEKLLAINPNDSRPLRQATVEKYAALMSAGAWELREEEPIVIDGATGAPIEGRHRLKAQKKAKRTIKYYINH